MRRVWILCAAVCFLATAAIAWGSTLRQTGSSLTPGSSLTSVGTGRAELAHLTGQHQQIRNPRVSGRTKRRPGGHSGSDHFLFGDRKLESRLGYSKPGAIKAFAAMSRANATATSIWVYVNARNKAGTLSAALYSNKDGHLGQRLTSGHIAPKAGAWNKVPITHIAVKARTTYWIAIHGHRATLYFRERGSRACRRSSSCPISAYVTGRINPPTTKYGTRAPSDPVGGAGATVPAAGGTIAAPGGTTTDPVSPVPTVPPLTLQPPQVVGQTAQGQTLSTNNGTWLGSPTSYSYAWEDCDSLGANCTMINNAAAAMYALTNSDVGNTIRSVVTASNAGGSSAASSPPTAVVTTPAPAQTAAPVVSGQAVQGQTLTTSNGSWSGSPTSYGYGWEDCNSSGASCSSIGGATASSYMLQASDVGDTIRSVVTARNGGGSAQAVSGSVGPVTGSSQSCAGYAANTPGGPDPWGGCFPGSWNTGVPSGTSLTPVPGSETQDPGSCTNGSGTSCWSWNGTDGNLYVRSCGVTLDDLNVSGNVVVLGIGNAPVSNGTFSASTPCITLENSQINGIVEINSNDGQGTNSGKDGPLVLTDDTVIAPNTASSSNVLSGNFYATGLNVYGGWESIACQSTCSITDSYAHGGFLACSGDHLTQCNGSPGTGGSGYHYDDFGSNGFWWNGSTANPPSTNGVTVEHDTWDCGFTNSSTTYGELAATYGAGCTADVGVNSDYGADNNLTLDKNLIVSDPTAYSPGFGTLLPNCMSLSNPATGKYYPYATNVHLTNNVFQKGSSPEAPTHKCGNYYPVDAWTWGDGNEFSGNLWDDGTSLTEPAGPTNTAPPVISGTPGNGRTLTVSNGTWTGSGITYSYRWFDCLTGQTVNCMQINAPEGGGGGETSSSYTMSSSDTPTYTTGDKIKAIVTACQSGGGCTNADTTPVN
jgi:hypothetical protein